jgi:uncharacterized protein (UPF0248 family)
LRIESLFLNISFYNQILLKVLESRNHSETIFGEVLSVEKIVPSKGMSAGVHLMVKTSKEIISVHLGPNWFLDKQEVSILVKDKIEIKGSRITYENKPAIIASEIVKGDKILILRSENGIPVWRGWRQR